MMRDDELRAMVREAVARHLETAAPVPSADGRVRSPSGPPWKQHSSHARFAVLMTPVDEDAPCIIEPAVRCTHCAFCQSYGH